MSERHSSAAERGDYLDPDVRSICDGLLKTLRVQLQETRKAWNDAQEAIAEASLNAEPADRMREIANELMDIQQELDRDVGDEKRLSAVLKSAFTSPLSQDDAEWLSDFIPGFEDVLLRQTEKQVGVLSYLPEPFLQAAYSSLDWTKNMAMSPASTTPLSEMEPRRSGGGGSGGSAMLESLQGMSKGGMGTLQDMTSKLFFVLGKDAAPIDEGEFLEKLLVEHDKMRQSRNAEKASLLSAAQQTVQRAHAIFHSALMSKIVQMGANQQMLEKEAHKLRRQTLALSKQVIAWNQLSKNVTQSAVELGNIKEWALQVERDMKGVAGSIEYARKQLRALTQE